jgi:predicted N-acyltransferase
MRTSVDACTVHDRLDGEAAVRWSSVVRGGPPQLSVRWLTCHENSFDRLPAYAVATGPDGQADAVAVFHVRRPGDHHTKYRVPDQLGHRAAAPSVVVVAPSSYVSGLYVRDGADARVAVDALKRTLVDLARRAGARTVQFPHLGDGAVGWFDDAIQYPMGPSAYLDLRGAHTFEDYLNRLPGRRRRETLRERRAFTAAGLRIRTGPSLSTADGLVQRQVAHYERYGLAADPDRIAGQFRALAEHYHDHLLLLEVVRDDDVVGHVLAVHEDDWVIPKLAAFRGRDSFAYFEAGYYAVIDWTLGSVGCGLIDYGGAAVDAKVRRGCTVRTLGGAVLPVD